nr:RNA-directed DNA polymerase, eukaryota [Tanacetum cinerariifolium]
KKRRYANVARFNRGTKTSDSQKSHSNVPLNTSNPSYAKVLGKNKSPQNHDEPVIVLEEGMLNFEGEPVLVGYAKDFKSLFNLQKVSYSLVLGLYTLKFRIELFGLIWKVECKEGKIIPDSIQNDAFIDSIAESELINGDSRENQFGQHILKPSNHPSGDPFGLEDLIHHYEYEKVEALRKSTIPQDSKKVRNDQTFHQVLEESVNKSSSVSKTAHAHSMAGPVKQRNGFSILECFQEFIDIGQAMGYKIKGCEKDFRHSLIEIDHRLDKGNGLPNDLTKRVNLFRELKDIDHKDSIDLAQKAKIKWAVEGDENSKFFHGIVNKKRRDLAIKGILVDGEWIENLNRVKSEFYSYYSNLFSAPAWDRSLFDVNFLRRLNSDQVFDSEDMVSNEEIKRAVWDCGSDKSPGQMDLASNFLRNFGLLKRLTRLGGIILTSFLASSVSKLNGVGGFVVVFNLLKLRFWSTARQRMNFLFIDGYGKEIPFIPSFLCSSWRVCMFLFKGSSLEVGANMTRLNSWSDVVKNMSNKLSNWKAKTLSVEGRLTLLKSIHGCRRLQGAIAAVECVMQGGIKNSQFIELGQILSSISLSSVGDRWSWTLHGLGGFSIKSAREEIDKHVLVVSRSQNRWSKVIPIKLNVFSWRMMLNRLPTRWWNIYIPIFDDLSSWDSGSTELDSFFSKKPQKDRIFDDIVSHTYFWLSNRCTVPQGSGDWQAVRDRWSLASSLDIGREYLKTRTTLTSDHQSHPNFCINKLAPSVGPREDDTTPRVNIQEFCEEYYEDILPIIMEK